MSHLRFDHLNLRAAACLIVVILLITSFASATYPGKNGRIAFIQMKSGSFQLYTMNSDGTDLLQITNLPATGFPVWSPDYSPDGQHIVFSHDLTGAIELYVINADGTGLRQLTNDGVEDLFPRWSQDGSSVVYSKFYIGSNQFFDHHLATINVDSTNSHFVTGGLFDDYEPAYFPDGTRIVFGSSRQNLRSALWTANANGSKPRRITKAALSAGSPDVSPDGLRLVFHSHESTELPPIIWSSKIDGTHLKRLTDPKHLVAAQPIFSPDGKQVVFVGNPIFPNPPNIYVMNPDGSGLTLILECPEGCLYPDWGSQP
jgi:TolB protein